MNASQFNAELAGLMQRGIKDGVAQNKMGVDNMVGILEIHKGELLRQNQDLARMAAKEWRRLGSPRPPRLVGSAAI